MAKNNIENIKIENARIVFRNLSGKPDKFNPQGGKRSFSVVIEDTEFANELKREGWNIKQFNPSPDSDEEPAHFISVKVSYNNIPPHIYLCTSKNKTLLNEDTVGQLDYAEISNVDIVITATNHVSWGDDPKWNKDTLLTDTNYYYQNKDAKQLLFWKQEEIELELEYSGKEIPIDELIKIADSVTVKRN